MPPYRGARGILQRYFTDEILDEQVIIACDYLSEHLSIMYSNLQLNSAIQQAGSITEIVLVAHQRMFVTKNRNSKLK